MFMLSVSNQKTPVTKTKSKYKKCALELELENRTTVKKLVEYLAILKIKLEYVLKV